MRISPKLVTAYLEHSVVQRRLQANVLINRKFDVPGLAACSKNGRVVYIDKDVGAPNEPLKNFALANKTFRDYFRLHPTLAKYLAVHFLSDFARELKHQVKRFNSSSLKHLPPDLDMNLYMPSSVRHLRMKNLAEKRRKTLTKKDRKSKMRGLKHVD